MSDQKCPCCINGYIPCEDDTPLGKDVWGTYYKHCLKVSMGMPFTRAQVRAMGEAYIQTMDKMRGMKNVTQ